jgi:hypothetical protein
MSRLKPDTAWRRIVENGKFPAKTRLMALEQIARPSLSLLRRLLSSKSTPSKLRLLAAERYSIGVARKELIRNAKQKSGSNSQ